MFDLSSNFCFHLRLTCDKARSKELITLFTAKFKPSKFVICHEISESGIEHSHSHIEADEAFFTYHISNKGKQARSDFFRKHNMGGLYNFQKLDRAPRQNICYVIKDGDYIAYKGITEAELEELKQWTAEIEKSKKLDTRDKLLVAFNEEHKDIPEFIFTPKNEVFIDGIQQFPLYEADYDKAFNQARPHELNEIASWIHWHFIEKWRKPPPTTHMREYVLWIASESCSMDTKKYYCNMFPL